MCDRYAVSFGLLDACYRAELFNLLINPLNHDFALRWHRDDVRENATAEEECEALAVWSHGVRPLGSPASH